MKRNMHIARSQRTYGVEIEATNVPRHVLVDALTLAGLACRDIGYTHDTTPYWKVTGDGSLTGNDTFELVSPVLRGAEGLAEIRLVCSILERLGAQVNRSCGVHVHHGAQDLSLKQFKHLLKYYLKYENAFDSLVAPSRRGNGNTFCQSSKVRFVSLKAAFKAIDRARTLEDVACVMTDRNRYYKLNLEAFWRHGTVEFRQHGGTIEYEKIAGWICLTQGLIEKAAAAKRIDSREGTVASLLRVTKMVAHTVRFFTARQTALNPDRAVAA